MHSVPQEAQISRLQLLASSIGMARSQSATLISRQVLQKRQGGARGIAAMQQEALVTQLLQKDQLAEAVAAVQQDIASVNRQQSLIENMCKGSSSARHHTFDAAGNMSSSDADLG